MKVYDPKIVKYDYFNTAVADILRAIDGGSLMGAFILAFCNIDYMGMAIDPSLGRNTSHEFKSFITEYMGAINPRYKEVQDELWAVRNSLVHVYGESSATSRINVKFQLSYQYPEYHLRLIERDGFNEFWLNGPEFIGDLIAAIENYFRNPTTNDEKLVEWYKKLLIISGASGAFDRLIAHGSEKPFSLAHRTLSPIDSSPNIGELEIASTIAKKIRERTA